MRFADILGVPVESGSDTETTALGVAYLIMVLGLE
jgi:glycerol kinase